MNKELYLKNLLLERSKWEGQLQENLRGGLAFIEKTEHIREMYMEHIYRIDEIIRSLTPNKNAK